MYYVYAYCNLDKPIEDNALTHQPFYIGKGSGRRINDHLRDAKLGKAGRKLTHIRRLLESKSLSIVKIHSYLSNEQEAFNIEIDLILKFGRKDLKTGCLFNCTPGGDGPKHSPEVYKAIGNKLRGRKATDEARRNISKSLTGRTRNAADGVKISKTLTGKKHDHARRQNIVRGMKESIERQRKKWLVVTPDTSFCIVSLDYLRENNLGSLYRSYQNGTPMKRGKLKGWQLSQITVS